MMARLICLFLLLPFFCIGQLPQPQKDTYVNDYTQTLTAEQVYQLNLHLQKLERESTVQMAILLIHHLPEGISLEDYSREVGNTWKVGNHFNGLVYVAVLQERKQRLEVARNLEGDIPDITAGKIIDHLKPHLQQEQYYQAMQLLILQVGEVLGVEMGIVLEESYQTPSSPSSHTGPSKQNWEHNPYEREKAKYDGYGDITIGFIILAFALFCFWAYLYRKTYRAKHTINGVYMGVGSAYFVSTYGSSYGSSGDGGSSSFGGFGGGGGGGFSGGGASGGW